MLRWQEQREAWPHSDASRLISSGAGHWHTQCFGICEPGAPVLLLLHGTGASGHSWRGLAPLLNTQLGCGIVTVDLPGHGFSSAKVSRSFRLPDVAQAILDLLHQQQWQSPWVVGHSAGAAIASQMSLLQTGGDAKGNTLHHARHIISLNGALLPLQGKVQRWFSPMAKLLSLNPFVPALFSINAQRASVVLGLLNGTGSKLDAQGIELYARLMRDPDHAAASLQLMAHWDLDALWQLLPGMQSEVHLWVGAGDRTVPPAQAKRVAQQLTRGQVQEFPALGHLMHEEQPELFAAEINKLIGGRWE